MEENLALITTYVEQYGIFFIVPLVLLENIPVLGLISPGLTILFLAGFFHEVLPGGLYFIFFMAYATMVVADTFWYFLGKKYGLKLAWLLYIRKKSPNVEKTIITQPFYILMFYQFVPYLRMFLPFSLGLYQFSWRKWLKTTLFGSFIFSLSYIGLGVIAALWYENIEDSSSLLGIAPLLAAILTVGLTIRLIRQYLEQRKLRVIKRDVEN